MTADTTQSFGKEATMTTRRLMTMIALPGRAGEDWGNSRPPHERPRFAAADVDEDPVADDEEDDDDDLDDDDEEDDLEDDLLDDDDDLLDDDEDDLDDDLLDDDDDLDDDEEEEDDAPDEA